MKGFDDGVNLRKEIEDFFPRVGFGFLKNSSGYEAYKRAARHFYMLGLKAGRADMDDTILAMRLQK